MTPHLMLLVEWLCFTILLLAVALREQLPSENGRGVIVSGKKILIVYHSQSGRNLRLAYAAARRVQKAGGQLRFLRAAEASSRDIVWAEALLLIFPENFGQLPGAMKDFFDRSFYAVSTRELIKPFAVFLCTGNDGRGAVRAVERIAKGMVLKPIAEPVICKGQPRPEDFSAVEDLAEVMVVGLEMGIY